MAYHWPGEHEESQCIASRTALARWNYEHHCGNVERSKSGELERHRNSTGNQESYTRTILDNTSQLRQSPIVRTTSTGNQLQIAPSNMPPINGFTSPHPTENADVQSLPAAAVHYPALFPTFNLHTQPTIANIGRGGAPAATELMTQAVHGHTANPLGVMQPKTVPQSTPCTYVSPASGQTMPRVSPLPQSQSHVDIKTEIQRPTFLPVVDPYRTSEAVSSSPSSHFLTSMTPSAHSAESVTSPFAQCNLKGSQTRFLPDISGSFTKDGTGYLATSSAPSQAGTHTVPDVTVTQRGEGKTKSKTPVRSQSQGNRSSSSSESLSTSPTSATIRPRSSSSAASRNSRPGQTKRDTIHSRCLPKKAKVVLREWLVKNLEYPYPSDQEKQKLAQSASITPLQVSYWFVNARRRQLPKLLDEENHQRSACNLPPIQIHPCARFSESFRPVRDSPGGNSTPTAAVNLYSSISNSKVPLVTQAGKEFASISYGVQPPLQVHQHASIRRKQQKSITTDGSDSSSDDSTSTWPMRDRCSNEEKITNSNLQRRQSMNMSMPHALAASQFSTQFIPANSMSSLIPMMDTWYSPHAAPLSAPKSASDINGDSQNMQPPPFAFPPQDKQLQSPNSKGSPSKAAFQNQHHSSINTQGQTTPTGKSGSKDDGSAINSLSPPITPSTSSTENAHHVSAQFTFPAMMPVGRPLLASYGSQEQMMTTSFHPEQPLTTAFY